MSQVARLTLARPELRLCGPARSRLASARIRTVLELASAHAAVTRGRLRMPVLSLLDRILPPGPLPAVAATFAPGVSLRVDGGGALARSALIAAGYEHREAELLAGALRPQGVFVDVGANVGWFSLVIGTGRPDVRVWAIEPVPATAAELSANVVASRLSTVEVIRMAAGARREHAVFTTHADNAFAHLAGQAGARLRHRPSGEVRCELVPLDELWSSRGRPRVDAMKIDVEGTEPDVLRGAGALLDRDHPLIVVEAPTRLARADLRTLLAPHGYRLRRCPGVLPYNAVFSVSG